MNAPEPRVTAARLYAQAPFMERQRVRLRTRICPFERVMSAVPRNASVLDVGCGNGLLAGLLIESGKAASVLGFDSAKESVAGAQRMAERAAMEDRAAFFHGGVDDDWPVGPFDAVTLVDVMHHLNPATRLSILPKAYASLRPGGVLIYKDMAARPWWAAAANLAHDLLFSGELARHLDLADITRVAQAVGFSKAAESKFRVLWYWHELILFVR